MDLGVSNGAQLVGTVFVTDMDDPDTERLSVSAIPKRRVGVCTSPFPR